MDIECPHCKREQLCDFGIIKNQWRHGEIHSDACVFCQQEFNIKVSVNNKGEIISCEVYSKSH